MITLTKMAAVCVLTVTSFTASAFADTYHHIDQLALKIDLQAKQLLSESRHYRHTSEYVHLYNDARQLSRLSFHLHEVAHHHGSLAHLESDLAQIDSKFHHAESLIERIEHNASYGHGHVHGHTSHVKHVLHSMEQNIHHLQEDIRSLRAHLHPVVVRPAITYPRRHSSNFGGNHASPHHGSGHRWGHGTQGNHSRGRGISFGGGSSKLSIRF
jgi:hypothetical protein